MIDIRTILKDFAEVTNSWTFIPARRDFQNLHDVSSFIYSQTADLATGETILFLDPVIREPVPDGVNVSGSFLILTNSNLDAASYDEKFLNYIAPLINDVQVTLYNKIRCHYDINTFRVIELINQFDFNGDGVHVSFNLKGHDRSFTIPELIPLIVVAPSFLTRIEQGGNNYIYTVWTETGSIEDVDSWVMQFSLTDSFDVIEDEVSGTYIETDFDAGWISDQYEIFSGLADVFVRAKNIKNGVSSDWFVESFSGGGVQV